MLYPLIERPRRGPAPRSRERGVTLALVALAMFGVIAMAALSIDVGTLYQANAEAQRSADAAALAGARVLSMSGMTGDPTNSSGLWGTACATAQDAATAVAKQNLVGGTAPAATVTFLATDGTNCTNQGGAFGVNPMVTVKVTQATLPTFFSRIFGRTGSSVSASATAEAFNPSASQAVTGSDLIPVQPRCVKPWIIPNVNPGVGAGSAPFVSFVDGTIGRPGIITNGTGIGAGVIGETLTLSADCLGTGTTCNSGPTWVNNPVTLATAGNLPYVPGQVLGAPVAIPSCANGNAYQQAIGGCDQTSPYQCGVQTGNSATTTFVNLNENPIVSGDTSLAVQCLIYQSAGAPDFLKTDVYPYEIEAGAGNPLGVNGKVITSSNSIVTLPIYDTSAVAGGGVLIPNASNQVAVNIVGFLQVFLGQVGGPNSQPITILNVAGCGNGINTIVSSQPVNGTSPVPVRLITSP
jgi:Flp pilus assembly protein TadG